VLIRVLCARQLRVGLRTYYPGFSVRDTAGAFAGFEPDIARRIADFLGVGMDMRAVDPKTRIPTLTDGTVDLVIATMGHSVQRDGEIRFIRPHYYRSETAIVGTIDSPVAKLADLSGNTVCLPLGAASNIMFARNHARILTFERPEQLIDALRFGECRLIVQDDTFFAGFFADPAWAAKFAIKFRFSPQPWGIGIARSDSAQFGDLLDALSVAFHADGTFLRLAEAHRLDLSFLRSEQAQWADPRCLTQAGLAAADCLAPPYDPSDAGDASALAPYVSWLERAIADSFGIHLDLSLFRNRITIGLLAEGIGYSLALIVGTQVSTLLIALGFGWLMVRGVAPVRHLIGAVTALGQVTPLPLLMFFASVLAGGIAHYSGEIALAAAIVAIGLYNGSNAARAFGDAHLALRRQAHEGDFRQAVALAGAQLVAFLINAAKGSPAAGMIGVPEFLNIVTDLTANSGDRVTMHVILLVFYVVLVLMVIRVLSWGRARYLDPERSS
jgi:ABC-type amino acid transport substrate-binding protein/ABC-type amino acid transport system permease subunit